jgi:hypothetical protein
VRAAELRRFAAKNLHAVENDREKAAWFKQDRAHDCIG